MDGALGHISLSLKPHGAEFTGFDRQFLIERVVLLDPESPETQVKLLVRDRNARKQYAMNIKEV